MSSRIVNFNGQKYNLKALREAVAYKFINKNEQITARDLSRALGYRYSSARRVLAYSYALITSLTLFYVASRGLPPISPLPALFTHVLAPATAITLAVAPLVLVGWFVVQGHDIHLIRKELVTVLKQYDSDQKHLIMQDYNFRNENNIVGLTHWSCNIGDKNDLIDSIFLNGVDGIAVSNKHTVASRPDLEQYRIRS